MLERTRIALRAVGYAEAILCGLLVVTILGIIAAQVFSRYVLGLPLIWVEELASYLLIWLGFLSAAVVAKQERHVAIRAVPAMERGRPGAAVGVLSAIALLALVALILAYVPTAMEIESRARTIGLPISIPRHWFFSVPLSVACASLVATALWQAASNAAALAGRGEHRAILPKHLVPEDDADEMEAVEAALTQGRSS